MILIPFWIGLLLYVAWWAEFRKFILRWWPFRNLCVTFEFQSSSFDFSKKKKTSNLNTLEKSQKDLAKNLKEEQHEQEWRRQRKTRREERWIRQESDSKYSMELITRLNQPSTLIRLLNYCFIILKSFSIFCNFLNLLLVFAELIPNFLFIFIFFSYLFSFSFFFSSSFFSSFFFFLARSLRLLPR